MDSKQSTLILYKKRGETPLECLNRFKKDNPKYFGEKMTYAGRLDPLAEGLLLVLVGEECKNKEKYLNLDKEYELDILFGFSTDSYDVLGKIVTLANKEIVSEKHESFLLKIFSVRRRRVSQVFSKTISFSATKISTLLQSFVGKFSQKYPPFSSKTVDGIPLFAYAKSGTLDPDEIPSKEVEIKSIEFLGEKKISKRGLSDFVKESINLVSGDFRQDEILESWESAISKTLIDYFPIFSIKVSCSSGTYMRSLANLIGEKLKIPALALNIKRTRIGKYEEKMIDR